MMIVKSAKFVISNSDPAKSPAPLMPEYAFIGRSNVGKSSLINSICRQNGLAKTSSKPGKTQLINHFLINEKWYLVDLPGYGFAKVSKTAKAGFAKIITDYLKNRENIMCLFVLIDLRLDPQKIDLEFLEFLGTNQIPFVILFTKADKLPKSKMKNAAQKYMNQLKETWEPLPPYYITSAETSMGAEDVLRFIEETNMLFIKPTLKKKANAE